MKNTVYRLLADRVEYSAEVIEEIESPPTVHLKLKLNQKFGLAENYRPLLQLFIEDAPTVVPLVRRADPPDSDAIMVSYEKR